jgi:hypothetical protein
MKGLNILLFAFLFIILFLRFYQIFKYGLAGYSEKKRERRQERNQQIINFFN